MKKVALLILLLSIALNACTRFILKYEFESDKGYYTRINKMTKDENVSLKMISEKIYNAKDLLINADSTIFYDLNSNLQRKVSTNEINAISYKSSGRAIWQGVLTGTLIGSIIVFVPLLAISASDNHRTVSLWYIAYGTLAGAAFGILYGYNNASTTVIELNK